MPFPFNIAGGSGGVSLASSATSGDVHAGDSRTGASTSGASGLMPSPVSTVTLTLLVVVAIGAYMMLKRK